MFEAALPAQSVCSFTIPNNRYYCCPDKHTRYATIGNTHIHVEAETNKNNKR